MYQLICNFIFENDFHQLVTNQTRAERILDLIFINDPLLVSDLAVQCPLANIDHNTIIRSMFVGNLNDPCNYSNDTSIGLLGGLCSPSTTHYYASSDRDALLLDLTGVDCRPCFPCFPGCSHVDDYWNTFYEILFHFVDIHVLKTTYRPLSCKTNSNILNTFANYLVKRTNYGKM